MPNMPQTAVLASASPIRKNLLEAAQVPITVVPARVDEDTIKHAMLHGSHSPRDIADALAEAKAQKVTLFHPNQLVIGADQTLEFDSRLLSKPQAPDEAVKQISELSGKSHQLHSAAVIFDTGRPVWRHVSTARLTMRSLSVTFIEHYVERNWSSIRHSVGGYKIEEEGPRLFSRIEGSHFAVLGLPLLEILSYLSLRGVIET